MEPIVFEFLIKIVEDFLHTPFLKLFLPSHTLVLFENNAFS